MSDTRNTMPAPPIVPLTDRPTLVSDTPVHRPHHAPVSIPEYEILEELGRGGMGVVYKARQRNLNRLVALKVILAGPYASEIDKGRFKLEAEAAGRLRHPNIVQVYDVGEHAGFGYIAFELVQGVNLRNLMDGRPMFPREAAHIVAVVARAIHHAHENGIIHRDLKPGNILLAGVSAHGSTVVTQESATDSALRSPDAQPVIPKVTDFGLAKELSSDSGLTLTGMACGTPNYMSPEQVRGASDAIDARTDVYGLGAILYEVLTGRPPFAGVETSRIMEMILKADPPSIRRDRPDTPRDLDVIAAKCLEKDPARRYQTAAEVADDLERFLQGRPVQARAVGRPERAWRWCRRNPWVALFLVLTSAGFALTGALAVRLARSEAVERSAHAEADQQRAAAELARDQLREALESAKAARARADELKDAALQQTGLAKTEQKRAEENLKLARSVLRNTMDEFTGQPLFQDPASRGLRSVLLRNTRAFVRQFSVPTEKDPALLEELFNLSMWVAYMEFLNGNLPTAATEYLTAGEIAKRWGAAEPGDTMPQLRLADALTNAGRAEYGSHQTERGELHLREALKLLDGVILRQPRKDAAYFMYLHTLAPLGVILRETGRVPDALATSRLALDRSHEAVHRFGLSSPAAAHLGEAHLTLAQDLIAVKERDLAECHLLEAIDLYDRAGPGSEHGTPNRLDATGARLALAGLYTARGRVDLAHETFQSAAAMVRRAGDTPTHQLQIATIEAAHGEALRRAGQFGPAEALLDRAIKASDSLMRRPAEAKKARDLWVRAAVSRAHLYNTTQRHREAVGEWDKLSKEDPDADARARHAMFVLQSLVFAGDSRAAGVGAARLDTGERPGWFWMDLARVWCRIAVAASADSVLSPAERVTQSDSFILKAVGCLERAKSQDFFKSTRMLKMVETEPDYALVRGRFNPRN